MLKQIKNYGLIFGIPFIILIFGSANVSLGVSAVMGVLLALWRIKILNDQTKIENGKLLLETEQIKFDMQAKTLAKIWDKVVELNMNNAIVLGLYQDNDTIDISQYGDTFLKGCLIESGLNEWQAQYILKGPKDKRKENFLKFILPEKLGVIFKSYCDLGTTYAKNKIILFPEMIKELDKVKGEIDKVMLTNYVILIKQIQYNEDRLKKQNTTLLNEDAKKLEKEIKEIEKICGKTEELCNETEKIIQDFLFSHISNSKNK